MNNYVMLTGSKSNAGDFLIKHRAKALLSEIRKDRGVVDLNGWEPIGEEQLEVINASRALILMGGPSLVSNMRPKVFKLPDQLSEIKVPITIMGAGWNSVSGRYSDCYTYGFSDKTKELLERIASDHQIISVRDYQAMHVLAHEGYKNVLMTGCPAYYDLQQINARVNQTFEIQNIAFSLGVSHVKSKRMELLMKEQISLLSEKLSSAKFLVVFHHSLDESIEKKSYGKLSNRFLKDLEFSEWLKSKGINYVDISGSAEALIDFYSKQDLHFGYRVHAHIFMNSIGKFSCLFTEDSRGKGSYGAIGGAVIDAYDKYEVTWYKKLLRKLGILDGFYTPNLTSTVQALDRYDYEKRAGYPLLHQARSAINENFNLMRRYLEQLP